MEDHVDFKKTGLKATIPRLRVLNIFEKTAKNISLLKKFTK